MDQEMEEIEPTETRLVLIVPKRHVKTVKTALEKHGHLDRTTKIVPQETAHGNESSEPRTENGENGYSQTSMRIPTTIPYDTQADNDISTILGKINLHHLSSEISLSHHTPLPSRSQNPLRATIEQVLTLLPPSILPSLNLTPARLAAAFPDSYSIYPPLLLLPSHAFSSPLWRALFAAHPISTTSLRPLWTHIAHAMGVTHIALNSPIPASHLTSQAPNLLRRPLNITPIHGSFGPPAPPRTPTPADYAAALWVRAVQNHITQIWSPAHSMFSRGNVREKSRIRAFKARSPAGAVVDMYAGIGYFSLVYARCAFRPVICFELNPWSVEGLRRGCVANGYTYRIFDEGNMGGWDEEDVGGAGRDVYVFNLSNELARPLLGPRIEAMPPVRHVNLGLLPSSRDSWRDAVGLVSVVEGGWVHAHENVGVGDVEARRREVEGIFQGYVDEMDGEGGNRVRKAEVRHVERVKMYAPGVVHCVFDVWIEGKQEKEDH